jgi:hypothetical protein
LNGNEEADDDDDRFLEQRLTGVGGRSNAAIAHWRPAIPASR